MTVRLKLGRKRVERRAAGRMKAFSSSVLFQVLGMQGRATAMHGMPSLGR